MEELEWQARIFTNIGPPETGFYGKQLICFRSKFCDIILLLKLPWCQFKETYFNSLSEHNDHSSLSSTWEVSGYVEKNHRQFSACNHCNELCSMTILDITVKGNLAKSHATQYKSDSTGCKYWILSIEYWVNFLSDCFFFSVFHISSILK